MEEKYYLTTPVYYVNDIPHIGHAYTQFAADILARWKRMQGVEVYFLTGTDEHGAKIASSAVDKGKSPKEHVDLMSAKFIEAWKKLNISYDGFVRTTDANHKETVQKIFQKLFDKGDIYKGEYEGWYCKPCESYWTGFQLGDSNMCPDCARNVEEIKEEAYFLAISKYQSKLLKYIEDHPDFIEPISRRHEIINFIETGLKDLNVSRTNFTWGIEVPFDTKHVIYVWFDALINYMSGIGYMDDPEKFNKYWPCDIHLMGKEIVRFHAVIWPAILMALELPLPKKIFGHGWWTTEGKKMSKSVGNIVDPIQLSKDYSLDALRYFLFREVPFGSDGDFSINSLVRRYNADLANDLGNLLNRTLTMIEKYFSGIVPESEINAIDDLDKEIMLKISETPIKVSDSIDLIDFTKALSSIWELISFSNVYIEKKSPWVLAKDNKTGELKVVFANLYEALRVISILIYPFMPDTSKSMRDQLGLKTDENISFDLIISHAFRDGIKINKGNPLFPRIEK